MGHALRRLPLNLAVPVVLAATVFLFAAGSSSVSALRDVGALGRWVALAVLFALGSAHALAAEKRQAPARPLYAAAAGLLALALLSTAWSVEPRLTLGRACSLLLLLATGGVLGLACAGRPAAIERLLLGLLGGAACVAAGGLVLLAADRGGAVQAASSMSGPARLRGLGESPNTVPMLIAVVVPIAVWRALGARGARGKTVGAAVSILLLGTLVAADSRGGLVASTAGLLTLAVLLGPSRRRRALTAAAVVLAFAAALAFSEGRPVPAARPLPVERATGASAPDVPPLEGEIGWPGFGTTPAYGRSLKEGSGRWDAWRGAVATAGGRPLAGYGFGTEEKVFVDRYWVFVGDRPENSYIGIYLQLGVAGVAALLGVLGALAASALQALRRPEGPERRLAAVCAAGVAGGFVLAVFQSYVYSAGNIASVSLWTCGFLLAAAAARPAVAGERAGQPPAWRRRLAETVPTSPA